MGSENRIEQLLNNILGEDVDLGPAQNRIEALLLEIADMPPGSGVTKTYVDNAIAALKAEIQAETEATAVDHLGFYLDGDGDLCQAE